MKIINDNITVVTCGLGVDIVCRRETGVEITLSLCEARNLYYMLDMVLKAGALNPSYYDQQLQKKGRISVQDPCISS